MLGVGVDGVDLFGGILVGVIGCWVCGVDLCRNIFVDEEFCLGIGVG